MINRLQLVAVLGAVAVALAAPPAFAAETVTAALATAVAKPVKVIAGGAIFACDGQRCVAAVTTSQTNSLDTCRQLFRQFGKVSAFGTEHRPFTAERLAKCNAA